LEDIKPTFSIINLADAKALLGAKNKVAFVDVRNRFSYDETHILNAMSLPLEDIYNRWETLNPQQEIILYGDSADDDDPQRAAEFLQNKGFHRVQILSGGLSAWDDAGYPTGRELFPEETMKIQSQFREPPH
jgi:rhodanese-related sulfurtransferase